MGESLEECESRLKEKDGLRERLKAFEKLHFLVGVRALRDWAGDEGTASSSVLPAGGLGTLDSRRETEPGSAAEESNPCSFADAGACEDRLPVDNFMIS